MSFASSSGTSPQCFNHGSVYRQPLRALHTPTPGRLRCHSLASGKQTLEPVLHQATAFAPATIANLGPGFDWIGCAVEVAPFPVLNMAANLAGHAPAQLMMSLVMMHAAEGRFRRQWKDIWAP